jgi:hypothetical protein
MTCLVVLGTAIGVVFTLRRRFVFPILSTLNGQLPGTVGQFTLASAMVCC